LPVFPVAGGEPGGKGGEKRSPSRTNSLGLVIFEAERAQGEKKGARGGDGEVPWGGDS